jgi:hypothetical protein
VLLGYELTFAIYASLILMIAAIVLNRKVMYAMLRERLDKKTVFALAAMVASFIIFALLFVSPVEQLYFDENIYQGIALNMLKNGNALWCQYGTGYFNDCYVNALYHDPVGWSAFIAIAFAIFGVGFDTAYGIELAVGAASIVLIFLTALVLTDRKSFALVSALSFLMTPMIYIWSRTQADVDLAFMTFSILSFFLFLVFVKKKNLYSLAAFAFSFNLVAYTRIEAILLLPVFAVLFVAFGENGIVSTMKERIGAMVNAIRNETGALVVLLAFVMLLLPELFYIAVQAQSPSYGQNAGESVISLTNFGKNISTNARFVLGLIQGMNYYPMAFHTLITPLAMLGVAILIFNSRIKNRFGILGMALLWFSAYFLFYTSFYAGAATYGVDSRFMLQLIPSLCLLATFAIIGISDIVKWLGVRTMRLIGRHGDGKVVFGSAVVALCAALLVYPFVPLVPIVAIAPSAMPQQSVILGAMNAFYSNYNSVPENCLVFTFTPDLWAEVNRSAAQIGYINGANSTLRESFSKYSCKVFDYGYWCVVPPHHSTTCAQIIKKYSLENLGPQNATLGGDGVSFYRILNYT